MEWIYEWNFFNEGECALFDGMRLVKPIEMESMKHRSLMNDLSFSEASSYGNEMKSIKNKIYF